MGMWAWKRTLMRFLVDPGREQKRNNSALCHCCFSEKWDRPSDIQSLTAAIIATLTRVSFAIYFYFRVGIRYVSFISLNRFAS